MPHSESNIDLAKALVAQDWWEWRDGMMIIWDGCASGVRFNWNEDCVNEECFPDLTDWATIGILLGWICDLQPHYELHAHGAVDCGEMVARQLLTLMNWDGGEKGI